MCEEAEQLHFECCVSPPVKWNRHKQFTEIYWGHCHCDMRSTSIVLLKYLDSNANILAQKHKHFVWIFGDYMWSAQWHMAIGRVSSCWGEAPGAFHAPLLEWGHALRRHQICRRTNIHHDFHNRICHLWRSAEREGIHASCTQKVDVDVATGRCAIMTCGVWFQDISRTITAAGMARWNPNTLKISHLEGQHLNDTINHHMQDKFQALPLYWTAKVCVFSPTERLLFKAFSSTVAVFVFNSHWAESGSNSGQVIPVITDWRHYTML